MTARTDLVTGHDACLRLVEVVPSRFNVGWEVVIEFLGTVLARGDRRVMYFAVNADEADEVAISIHEHALLVREQTSLSEPVPILKLAEVPANGSS
jgi:hypothetical protein